MLNLAILIPSYKRPQVLATTLNGLVSTLSSPSNYISSVSVGLNKVSQIDMSIAESFKPLFKMINIDYQINTYKENEGKAFVLNDLFNCYAIKSDYTITLDNDMLLKMPWLHLIDIARQTDFELLGFGSSLFWAHIPPMSNCDSFEVSGYMFYKPQGIAGGMMLFPTEFLARHPWTNLGGVYGRDDEQMCLKTSRKYVLNWPVDWLHHDPVSKSTQDLFDYHAHKEALFNKGIYVFKKGWDETCLK